jgi:hypothetical protein
VRLSIRTERNPFTAFPKLNLKRKEKEQQPLHQNGGEKAKRKEEEKEEISRKNIISETGDQ